MSKFFGDAEVKLVRGPSLQPVASVAEALAGKKYVLVYFSAHWCPPCRIFTPQLRHFYDKFSHDKNFEVIFVSLDRSAEAMSAYMESAHGNWLAMTYDCAKGFGQQMAKQSGIETIPAMLVFENAPDGRKLITTVGRDMVVHDEEAEKFPWPNGEADMKAYKNGLLRNIGICIIIALVIGYSLMRYTF